MKFKFIDNLKKFFKNKNFISFILTTFYGIILIYSPRIFSLIENDSQSYIEFDAIRSSFYPLLIKILLWTGLELNTIITFQCIVFLSSIYFVIYTFLKLKFNFFLIILLYISVSLNIYYNGFHFTILTESISFSLLLYFLGFFIRYIYLKNNTSLILSIIFISLLSIQKPSTMAILIPVIAILSLKLIFDGNVKQILKFIILPTFMVFLFENIIFYTFNDKRKNIVLTNHIHGKALMINLMDKDYLFNKNNFRKIDDFYLKSKALFI